MRKFSRLLLLVPALALLLGLAVQASRPGVLTIWADDTRTPVFRALGERFTKQTGVPVQVVEQPFGDIRDRVAIAGPAGEGPDLLIGAHDWLGQLVAGGLIEPLEFMTDRAGEFNPAAVRAFTTGGRVYAVPYTVEAIALFHNKKLLPNPPRTWAELVQTSLRLTDRTRGQFGFVLQQNDPYHSYPIFSGSGGFIFRQGADGTFNPNNLGLDSPGGIAGARLIERMLRDGVMPSGIDYSGMTTLFKEGRAAMVMTGPWAIADFKAAGVDYGIARIPAIDGNPARPFVGVQGVMLSAFSVNKLLAATFLNDFVATDASMQAIFERDRRPPAFNAVAERLRDDPDIQAIVASAATGVPMPSIPEMSAVWGAWTDALALIFNRQAPADQAIRDAAQRIRVTIAESK